MWTIYCHTHVASGRRYIGMTKKTMLRRWNQHVYISGLLVKIGWSHFANAIREYGKDAFEHKVLETCETLEAANAAEERWIEKFETRDREKGFNIRRGGLHTPHPVRNPWDRPEYREKQAGLSKILWSDPTRRLLLSTLQKTRYLDPSLKERALMISREVHSRPNVKKKLSKASKTMWSRSDYREKQDRFGLPAIAKALLSRTCCKNGHEFSSENTRIQIKKGTTYQIRVCLTCQRNRHIRSAENMTEAQTEIHRVQNRNRMKKKRALNS
jgi:hypothetical protein